MGLLFGVRLNMQLLNYKIKASINNNNHVPIVLIHGLFGDMDNLAMLARLLDDYKVISIDVRNHGDSFHSESMNYQLMAQDVVNVLEYLKLDKVMIIGHSMGGKIAMKLTELVPDKIAKLIVLDIAPVKYDRKHDKVLSALKIIENKELNRQAALEVMAESLDEMTSQFLLKSFKNGRFKFNVKAIDAHYNDIADWQKVTAFLGKTLFIVGGNSDYVLPRYQSEIIEQFPEAKAKVVVGTGHWLHAEKTDAVMKIIQDFLSK